MRTTLRWIAGITAPALLLTGCSSDETDIEVSANAATGAAEDTASPASAEESAEAEIAVMTEAIQKYRDVTVAEADGYEAAGHCEETEDGGMGIHYVNNDLLMAPPDPLQPQILLYEPVGDGLELVGVEYLMPDADQDLDTDEDRPSIFGQHYDGPMEGHTPEMPIHYDLHIWNIKENPNGRFEMWNPDVRCDG